MVSVSHQVAVALGSNLGVRESHLEYAVERLRALLSGFQVSTVHETEPEGPPALRDQPKFLNAAVVGWCDDDPSTLLNRLLSIEGERGRERPYVGAPRTLDLDLILMGRITVVTSDVTVPHPRFRDRRFVLEPLAEVGPEMVDPVTELTVRRLLERLDDAE